MLTQQARTTFLKKYIFKRYILILLYKKTIGNNDQAMAKTFSKKLLNFYYLEKKKSDFQILITLSQLNRLHAFVGCFTLCLLHYLAQSKTPSLVSYIILLCRFSHLNSPQVNFLPSFHSYTLENITSDVLISISNGHIWSFFVLVFKKYSTPFIKEAAIYQKKMLRKSPSGGLCFLKRRGPQKSIYNCSQFSTLLSTNSAAKGWGYLTVKSIFNMLIHVTRTLNSQSFIFQRKPNKSDF